jgi:hypothetical protein
MTLYCHNPTDHSLNNSSVVRSAVFVLRLVSLRFICDFDGSFHAIKEIKVPLEIIVNSEAGHLNAIAILLITLKFYTHPYDHLHSE